MSGLLVAADTMARHDSPTIRLAVRPVRQRNKGTPQRVVTGDGIFFKLSEYAFDSVEGVALQAELPGRALGDALFDVGGMQTETSQRPDPPA